MARPTKKEQAAKKKASEANAASNREEILKKQEELRKKSEERNAKKKADIENKNKKSDELTNSNPSEEIPNNEVAENTASNQEANNVSSEENTISMEEKSIEETSSADANQEASNTSTNPIVDDSNDIPDVNPDVDIPNDIAAELEGSSESGNDYNMPDDDFDPLEEKVIRRSYTDGNLGAKKDDNISADGKSQTAGLGENTPPVIEPEISEPIIKTVEPIETPDATKSIPKTDKPKTEPVNPKLEDLSPNQKRKAAEKSADVLITNYANLAPLPFKKLSSFNMRKLEKRHMNDEIDMHMKIMDDGTTIHSYCEQVNLQADATFVITKEMQDEIREPLIDVLLENNFALTPTQRLIAAVGGQLLQMGMTGIQFMAQNRDAMDTFKKFHEENKSVRSEIVHKVQPNPNPQPQPQPKKESHKKEVVKDDVVDLRDKTRGENMDIPDDNETLGEKLTVEEFLSKD